MDYENAAAIELIELGKVDKDGPLAGVCNAAKPIERINALDRKAVESLHRPATLTLVVRNTVARARELYDSLRGKKASGKGGLSPKLY